MKSNNDNKNNNQIEAIGGNWEEQLFRDLFWIIIALKVLQPEAREIEFLVLVI